MVPASVVPIGKARRRLPPVFRAVLDCAVALVRPHRAALGNLIAMPLTAFGLGAIVTGVFYASVIAGWIVLGLAAMFLEHLIADEA